MADTIRSKSAITYGVGAILSTFLLTAPVRSFAEDPKSDPKVDAKATDETTAKVTELELQAKKHAADKSDDALMSDLKQAVTLYAQVAETKLKARLVLVAGTILQGTTHDGLQKAGIKALGDIADPTGFRFIRKFVIQQTPDENPPLMPDAIESASKMKANDSVPLLLDLVQHSHVMPIAAAAIKAFGTFGQNKSTRTTILSELIETVKKDVPGVGWRWSANGGLTGPPRTRTAPTRTGEDTVNRFQALAGPMVETLNKMTGQNVPDTDTWFDMKDKYKADLGQLFPK